MALIDTKSTTVDWQKLRVPYAVLPIGACEQHCSHLPLNTDTVFANYFAEFVATELEAGLLPGLPIFTSLEHSGFRGSLSLKPETAMAVIRDITDELEKQNFTRLIVINGHGGNFSLFPVIRDINRSDKKIKILVFNPWSYDFSNQREVLHAQQEIHGGAWETSLMLKIAPELVGDYESVEDGKFVVENATQSDLNHLGLGALTNIGIVGKPRHALAEAGEKIVASMKENMLIAIKERLAWLDKQSNYSGKGPVVVREMTENEITEGEKLCRLANWNQLRADWDLFHNSSQTTALAAIHNGQLVGTGTTINYDDENSWIGMILVNPEYRRMGIATKLLNQCIDTLSSCKCIKLDATPDGKKVYDKLGFKDEYTLARYTVDKVAQIEAEDFPGIRPATPEDLDMITKFDQECFGVERKELIRGIYAIAPGYSYISFDDNNTINGYTLGRHGANFEYLGPINALSQQTAINLCLTLLSTLTGKSVAIDPLEDKYEWIEWLKQTGFSYQRSFIRMYKGKNIPGNTDFQYAIMGPEFG